MTWVPVGLLRASSLYSGTTCIVVVPGTGPGIGAGAAEWAGAGWNAAFGAGAGGATASVGIGSGAGIADCTVEGSVGASTPAAAGAAFGFTGAGLGDALAVAAVASVFLAGVASSGMAVGSTVPAGDGAAFGFTGAGLGDALAVASGFLAGVASSGKAAGSTVPVVPRSPLEPGVDPGGHVIQHSASARSGRISPATATSSANKIALAFMILPPFILLLVHAHFSRRVRERQSHLKRLTVSVSGLSAI
jgi:hypothetical protein